MDRKSIVLIISIVFLFALFFLVPACVMWIFNTCVPGLFGIASLTYWQAFGLYILCGILFNQPNFDDEKLKNKFQALLDEIVDGPKEDE
jgi:hypothetical protein